MSDTIFRCFLFYQRQFREKIKTNFFLFSLHSSAIDDISSDHTFDESDQMIRRIFINNMFTALHNKIVTAFFSFRCEFMRANESKKKNKPN